MRSRRFLYIGLAFFLLALGSLVLSRSPKVARRVVRSELRAEALASAITGPSPTVLVPARTPTRKLSGPQAAPSPPAGSKPGEPESTQASVPRPPAPEPTQTSSSAAPVPMSQMTTIVEAEWPEKIEFGRSDAIRVSLMRTASGDWEPTVEGAGHTARSATVVPVGTPEAPLQQAFGTEYEGCAVANLVGSAFEIQAINAGCQSLDMPRITWEWNLMAKVDGPQVVNANIEAVWTPIKGEGKEIRRQIWRAQLTIGVTKPLIARGQLQIFSFVEGLVGSVFSVPWLYERWKELTEKRKKGKSPPGVSPDSR